MCCGVLGNRQFWGWVRCIGQWTCCKWFCRRGKSLKTIKSCSTLHQPVTSCKHFLLNNLSFFGSWMESPHQWSLLAWTSLCSLFRGMLVSVTLLKISLGSDNSWVWFHILCLCFCYYCFFFLLRGFFLAIL